MDWVDNTSYLIGALKHFNNGLNSLSSDIWISVKTLNEFLDWKASTKTIWLVERFVTQKMGAINNLMNLYRSSVLENYKAANVVTNEQTELKIKISKWLEVEYKWEWERWWAVDAKWVYIDEKQFIIKKGSTCTHTKRLELLHHKKGNNLRRKVEKLLRWKDPYLVKTWIRSYEFVRDCEVGSASAAMSILMWHSQSGKTTWVIRWTDKTINDYFWN